MQCACVVFVHCSLNMQMKHSGDLNGDETICNDQIWSRNYSRTEACDALVVLDEAVGVPFDEVSQALVACVRREAAAPRRALQTPLAQTVVLVHVHLRREERAAARAAGESGAIDDGAEWEDGTEVEGVVATLRTLVVG